jgi:hypothetical protein
MVSGSLPCFSLVARQLSSSRRTEFSVKGLLIIAPTSSKYEAKDTLCGGLLSIQPIGRTQILVTFRHLCINAGELPEDGGLPENVYRLSVFCETLISM